MMTNQALTEMYDYWEKQATLHNKQLVQLQKQNPEVMSVIIYFVY